MNEHKLLRMIEEAGFDFTPDIMNKLQKFQNLIWIEREECAKVCEQLQIPNVIYGAHPDYVDGKLMAVEQCADAIRARGVNE